MKNLIKSLTLCTVAGVAANLNAATFTVSPTALTDGYMSWTPVAGDAAGYGGAGSSGWGLSALQANFSGSTLTLNPNVNTYDGVGDNYWVNADGTGANLMDASIYCEVDSGGLANQSVTFTFDVLANTLSGPYSADAFVKDFGPGYSYNGEQTVALTPGIDSVTYALTGN